MDVKPQRIEAAPKPALLRLENARIQTMILRMLRLSSNGVDPVLLITLDQAEVGLTSSSGGRSTYVPSSSV